MKKLQCKQGLSLLTQITPLSHNDRMQQGPFIFSVHELTRYIKTTLERDHTLQGVMVRGEISDCKYHTSGHMYFVLKDEASQLRCVMWRERVLAQSLHFENGMRVTAEGSITLYERGGYYQFNAYNMQSEGLGNLFQAFEQLKRKLEMEGLFERTRETEFTRVAPPYCFADFADRRRDT